VKTVGILATAATGALVVLAAAVGVVSIPDIKRYLSMRRM